MRKSYQDSPDSEIYRLFPNPAHLYNPANPVSDKSRGTGSGIVPIGNNGILSFSVLAVLVRSRFDKLIMDGLGGLSAKAARPPGPNVISDAGRSHPPTKASTNAATNCSSPSAVSLPFAITSGSFQRPKIIMLYVADAQRKVTSG